MISTTATHKDNTIVDAAIPPPSRPRLVTSSRLSGNFAPIAIERDLPQLPDTPVEAAPNASTEMASRHAEYRRVLRWAADLISDVATSSAQRALLNTALIGLNGDVRRVAGSGRYVIESARVHLDKPRTSSRGSSDSGKFSAQDHPGRLNNSIALPLAVYAAITGKERAAVPLAAACGFANLAIDLFDDLADGDRQAHWAGRSLNEMSLAAATVLGTLPPLILARLDLEPARRLRMQEILAARLLRASAGQQEDLRQTGMQAVPVEEVEAAVIGKTGERFAAYCELAAEMAGANPAATGLYADYGREVGVSTQLLSDCHDVLVDPDARDLAHGTRTLPIVIHLNRLDSAERLRFLELLDRARTDRQAQVLVRDELRATGAIRRVIARAELCRARARRIVDEAAAREPGRGWLLALATSGLEEPDLERLRV